MSDVIKSGYLKRFSKSFMDGGWKKIWIVLHKNSKLELFKKQSDTTSKGHVMMKEVSKYFAFGQYTENMPERPSLPKDGRMDWLLAIPQKPSSQAKVHWFLCDSDKQLGEWMEAIVSTLPPVPSHQQGSAPTAPQPQPVFEEVQAVKSNPVSAPPPPYAPPYGPPPVGGLGFDQMSISQAPRPPPPAGGYYPQQGYPVQPGPYPPQPGYQPPPQQYQQPYPTQQPYPQQPYYPQQPPAAAYPRQPYAGQPAQGYAQGYYTPQGQYVAYPQGQYPQGQTQYVQQPNVVYIKEKKNKGILGGSGAKTAAGLAGGALLGYGAARMIGGGPFGYGGYGHYGGFGMGRCGSWSSLSSCGSFGSFSSFGSWD